VERNNEPYVRDIAVQGAEMWPPPGQKKYHVNHNLAAVSHPRNVPASMAGIRKLGVERDNQATMQRTFVHDDGALHGIFSCVNPSLTYMAMTARLAIARFLNSEK